jgi:hypothetical protein
MKSGQIAREDLEDRFVRRKKLLGSYMPLGARMRIDERIRTYADERTLTSLRAAYDLIDTMENVGLVVRNQWITIYCNSLEHLSPIQKFLTEFQDTARHTTTNANTIVVTEAIIDRPRNTIRRASSIWSYRIKMRHISASPAQHAGIRQFLNTYENDLQPSASLKEWARKEHKHFTGLESHYFIDCNDRKLTAMLELCAPGVIDKVFEIIVDK